MPTMSICAEPGCGRLMQHTKNANRCPQHQAEYDQKLNAKKFDRRVRDGRDTKAWARTRLIVLSMCDHTCEHPGCTAEATQAHSIHGGYHQTDPRDFRGLCSYHHGSIHGRENMRRTATDGIDAPPFIPPG